MCVCFNIKQFPHYLQQTAKKIEKEERRREREKEGDREREERTDIMREIEGK